LTGAPHSLKCWAETIETKVKAAANPMEARHRLY
jgi:hypothetical protein